MVVAVTNHYSLFIAFARSLIPQGGTALTPRQLQDILSADSSDCTEFLKAVTEVDSGSADCQAGNSEGTEGTERTEATERFEPAERTERTENWPCFPLTTIH